VTVSVEIGERSEKGGKDSGTTHSVKSDLAALVATGPKIGKLPPSSTGDDGLCEEYEPIDGLPYDLPTLSPGARGQRDAEWVDS